MPVMIRPALPVDRDAIVAIHSASWRDSYRGILPDDQLGPDLEGRHQTLWSQIFGKPVPGRVILVGVVDNAVRGFIISNPDREDPGLDFIAALHVAPEARGQAIGGTLMREWADRMTGIGRKRAMLFVADGNQGARRFYRRLGGVEGPAFDHNLGGHGEAPSRRVTWEDIAVIACRARGERIHQMQIPAKLAAAEVAHWSGAIHPVDASNAARARRKQPLGDPFGLTDFGVNRVEVDPGIRSTVQHFHSHEDEFVLVLDGDFILHLDGREVALTAGDCAGFPAGEGPAHVLENRGATTGVYLEIGSRWLDRDICRYRDQDLVVDQGPDGNRWFLRLDGTPVIPAD
ncbi:GNAT family N-acetyltransferase [Rhodobacteraceae bacterium NNCM2]|nr:GNAT family N-acetyltransferase [Coraliihabitans acroporae]